MHESEILVFALFIAQYTVTEDEIKSGMKDVFQRLKMVIEPSAGVGPGLVTSKRFQSIIHEKGLKNVGVVLCGGNLDLNSLLSIK